MMLLSNSTAFSRFFRQVVTNGLPVVFLVNYLGFVAVSLFLEKKKQSAIQFLALEGFVRGVTFVGLHVLVYVLSADLFGSFGGNRGTALRVVGPTLERSFLFENISGVYLYALLPGVFIGHAAVLSNLGSVTGNAARTLIKFAALASCLFPILVVTALSAGLAQLFRVPG